MTYETFKQIVGVSGTVGNPIEQAFYAESSTRKAVGYVERDTVDADTGRLGESQYPVYVKKMYKRDDGDEMYVVRAEIDARYVEEELRNEFVADAVFEKLVNDYDLNEIGEDIDADEAQELFSDDDTDEDDGGGGGVRQFFFPGKE